MDDTAEHVKSTVREKVNYAAGVVRGVRAAIVSLLNTDAQAEAARHGRGTAVA